MVSVRALTFAATLAVVSAAAQASTPVVSGLSSGFTFEQYTGTAPVGSGQVDIDNTLFFIPEKTVDGLQSFYIFFDPLHAQTVNATITFSSTIEDAFYTKATLDASNAEYGNPSITYTTSTFIGLEGNGQDYATVSGNVLKVHLDAIDPGDDIRVLISAPAVPEPGTYALFGIGLVGLVAAQRRRKA